MSFVSLEAEHKFLWQSGKTVSPTTVVAALSAQGTTSAGSVLRSSSPSQNKLPLAIECVREDKHKLSVWTEPKGLVSFKKATDRTTTHVQSAARDEDGYTGVFFTYDSNRSLGYALIAHDEKDRTRVLRKPADYSDKVAEVMASAYPAQERKTKRDVSQAYLTARYTYLRKCANGHVVAALISTLAGTVYLVTGVLSSKLQSLWRKWQLEPTACPSVSSPPPCVYICPAGTHVVLYRAQVSGSASTVASASATQRALCKFDLVDPTTGVSSPSSSSEPASPQRQCVMIHERSFCTVGGSSDLVEHRAYQSRCFTSGSQRTEAPASVTCLVAAEGDDHAQGRGQQQQRHLPALVSIVVPLEDAAFLVRLSYASGDASLCASCACFAQPIPNPVSVLTISQVPSWPEGRLVSLVLSSDMRLFACESVIGDGEFVVGSLQVRFGSSTSSCVMVPLPVSSGSAVKPVSFAARPQLMAMERGPLHSVPVRVLCSSGVAAMVLCVKEVALQQVPLEPQQQSQVQKEELQVRELAVMQQVAPVATAPVLEAPLAVLQAAASGDRVQLTTVCMAELERVAAATAAAPSNDDDSTRSGGGEEDGIELSERKQLRVAQVLFRTLLPVIRSFTPKLQSGPTQQDVVLVQQLYSFAMELAQPRTHMAWQLWWTLTAELQRVLAGAGTAGAIYTDRFFLELADMYQAGGYDARRKEEGSDGREESGCEGSGAAIVKAALQEVISDELRTTLTVAPSAAAAVPNEVASMISYVLEGLAAAAPVLALAEQVTRRCLQTAVLPSNGACVVRARDGMGSCVHVMGAVLLASCVDVPLYVVQEGASLMWSLEQSQQQHQQQHLTCVRVPVQSFTSQKEFDAALVMAAELLAVVAPVPSFTLAAPFSALATAGRVHCLSALLCLFAPLLRSSLGCGAPLAENTELMRDCAASLDNSAEVEVRRVLGVCGAGDVARTLCYIMCTTLPSSDSEAGVDAVIHIPLFRTLSVAADLGEFATAALVSLLFSTTERALAAQNNYAAALLHGLLERQGVERRAARDIEEDFAMMIAGVEADVVVAQCKARATVSRRRAIAVLAHVHALLPYQATAIASSYVDSVDSSRNPAAAPHSAGGTALSRTLVMCFRVLALCHHCASLERQMDAAIRVSLAAPTVDTAFTTSSSSSLPPAVMAALLGLQACHTHNPHSALPLMWLQCKFVCVVHAALGSVCRVKPEWTSFFSAAVELSRIPTKATLASLKRAACGLQSRLRKDISSAGDKSADDDRDDVAFALAQQWRAKAEALVHNFIPSTTMDLLPAQEAAATHTTADSKGQSRPPQVTYIFAHERDASVPAWLHSHDVAERRFVIDSQWPVQVWTLEQQPGLLQAVATDLAKEVEKMAAYVKEREGQQQRSSHGGLSMELSKALYEEVCQLVPPQRSLAILASETTLPLAEVGNFKPLVASAGRTQHDLTGCDEPPQRMQQQQQPQEQQKHRNPVVTAPAGGVFSEDNVQWWETLAGATQSSAQQKQRQEVGQRGGGYVSDTATSYTTCTSNPRDRAEEGSSRSSDMDKYARHHTGEGDFGRYGGKEGSKSKSGRCTCRRSQSRPMCCCRQRQNSRRAEGKCFHSPTRARAEGPYSLSAPNSGGAPAGMRLLQFNTVLKPPMDPHRHSQTARGPHMRDGERERSPVAQMVVSRVQDSNGEVPLLLTLGGSAVGRAKSRPAVQLYGNCGGNSLLAQPLAPRELLSCRTAEADRQPREASPLLFGSATARVSPRFLSPPPLPSSAVFTAPPPLLKLSRHASPAQCNIGVASVSGLAQPQHVSYFPQESTQPQAQQPVQGTQTSSYGPMWLSPEGPAPTGVAPPQDNRNAGVELYPQVPRAHFSPAPVVAPTTTAPPVVTYTSQTTLPIQSLPLPSSQESPGCVPPLPTPPLHQSPPIFFGGDAQLAQPILSPSELADFRRYTNELLFNVGTTGRFVSPPIPPPPALQQQQAAFTNATTVPLGTTDNTAATSLSSTVHNPAIAATSTDIEMDFMRKAEALVVAQAAETRALQQQAAMALRAAAAATPVGKEGGGLSALEQSQLVRDSVKQKTELLNLNSRLLELQLQAARGGEPSRFHPFSNGEPTTPSPQRWRGTSITTLGDYHQSPTVNHNRAAIDVTQSATQTAASQYNTRETGTSAPTSPLRAYSVHESGNGNISDGFPLAIGSDARGVKDESNRLPAHSVDNTIADLRKLNADLLGMNASAAAMEKAVQETREAIKRYESQVPLERATAENNAALTALQQSTEAAERRLAELSSAAVYERTQQQQQQRELPKERESSMRSTRGAYDSMAQPQQRHLQQQLPATVAVSDVSAGRSPSRFTSTETVRADMASGLSYASSDHREPAPAQPPSSGTAHHCFTWQEALPVCAAPAPKEQATSLPNPMGTDARAASGAPFKTPRHSTVGAERSRIISLADLAAQPPLPQEQSEHVHSEGSETEALYEARRENTLLHSSAVQHRMPRRESNTSKASNAVATHLVSFLDPAPQRKEQQHQQEREEEEGAARIFKTPADLGAMYRKAPKRPAERSLASATRGGSTPRKKRHPSVEKRKPATKSSSNIPSRFSMYAPTAATDKRKPSMVDAHKRGGGGGASPQPQRQQSPSPPVLHAIALAAEDPASSFLLKPALDPYVHRQAERRNDAIAKRIALLEREFA